MGLVDDNALKEHFRTLRGISSLYHTSLLDLYSMPVVEMYWLIGVA